MVAGPRDVAQVRLDNALLLFEEFVRATARHADAATLRGLERRFAERLQIQPSYWSQIKGRSRQIGERLARQFEVLCHKPAGWMDLVHSTVGDPASDAGGTEIRRDTSAAVRDEPSAQNDDERFILALVLTYYRRHPQRAKARLLDLLGEVLSPHTTEPPAGHAPEPPRTSASRSDEGHDLWVRSQGGVAPLKRTK